MRIVAIADVIQGLLLRAQLRIRAHQVAGVEHDAHVVVLDPVEQAARHRRVAEREPGPPLVFHEQRQIGVHTVENQVDYLARTVADLAVGMAELTGEAFLHPDVGHVEHDIFRPEIDGTLQVASEPRNKFFTRFGSVAVLHGIPCAELVEQCRLVADPEIDPRREEQQVIAHHEIVGKRLGRIVLMPPHNFDAVQAKLGAIGSKCIDAAVFVEASVVHGEVGKQFHDSLQLAGFVYKSIDYDMVSETVCFV